MARTMMPPALALMILCGALTLPDTASAANSFFGDDPIYQVTYWEEAASKKGLAATHDELIDLVDELPIENLHYISHMFGRVVYHELGVEGANFCDPRPTYGCYHEVVGQYLMEFGDDADLSGFRQTCDKLLGVQAMSCIHGIGHGVMAYAGYTLEGLRYALAKCDEVSHPSQNGFCHSGIFMEYDFRDMESFPPPIRVPAEGESWWSPCDDIEPQYRIQCIRRRPYWWVDLLRSRSFADRMVRMGELCRQHAGDDARILDACFAGIGRTMSYAQESFDPAEAPKLCRLAAADERLTRRCLIETVGAMTYFFGDVFTACMCSRDRRNAPRYCTEGTAPLSGSMRKLYKDLQ